MKYDPTIEDSYIMEVVVNDQQCTLEIIDTAGVDEYSHFGDEWIRANEGFILVYSISSRLSFTRIQGLYDQIQKIKKSTHPHSSSRVPIVLVGNKVDIAKRKVSLLEGEGMARKLGCKFLEASAKDGGNVEESFYTIVRQLQKPSATTGIKVLDDLLDSQPKWKNLVSHLEDEISKSAIANTRPLVPVEAPWVHAQTELPAGKSKAAYTPTSGNPQAEDNVSPRFWQRFATTLHVPRFAKRQRSFPGINSFQSPSRPQSRVSQNQRASSVGCGMSQPSENPDHYVLEGNYNLQVQMAFGDIVTFLSRLWSKIKDFERKEKFARMMAAIDIEDNCMGGDVCSEIRDNEETLAVERVEKVDKVGIVQQVKLALVKCQKLCEDASDEVVRRGECRDKIQEMKKEFAGVIEIAAKLHSRGAIA
jgi:GTPase KRas protein